MTNIKSASILSDSSRSNNIDFSLQQNSLTREKKLKRYPFSNGTVKLSSPCPYCGHRTGLVIVRFKEDSGFVRCCRCGAALFSIAEASKDIGLTHIGTILDNYLPTLASFSEVAS